MEKLTVREEIVIAALLKTSEDNMRSLVESGVSENLTKMLLQDLQEIGLIRRKLGLDCYHPSN